MSIPAKIQLQTLFTFNAQGRIVSTREPNPGPGPAFCLIRRADACAWAVGATVPDEKALQLERLALNEPPNSEFRQPPKHAQEYLELVGDRVESGPAFEFPDPLEAPDGVVMVNDIEILLRSFAGWTEDELPERSPIMAVLEQGKPVSVCFCARVSESAAEAGLETVPAFRGRGLAGLVTTAWAAAIRSSGRTPIYSTSWRNESSLAVARKLGLVTCASYWSVYAKADG